MSTDPLKAAQEAVELRKKAVGGIWEHKTENQGSGSSVYTFCSTPVCSYYDSSGGFVPEEKRNTHAFIAHAGNHYAAVSQALLDAQAKLEALVDCYTAFVDAMESTHAGDRLYRQGYCDIAKLTLSDCDTAAKEWRAMAEAAIAFMDAYTYCLPKTCDTYKSKRAAYLAAKGKTNG